MADTKITAPIPVGLKRKDGVVVQDCDVYVGRMCNMGGWRLKDSKWHNPYKLKEYNNKVHVVLKKYRRYVLRSPELLESLGELSGKRIGCFCIKKGNEPCHTRVLKELWEAKFVTKTLDILVDAERERRRLEQQVVVEE